MSKTPAKIGFTEFAETWNGRLAMLGFVAAIINELVSGKGHFGSDWFDVARSRSAPFN